MQGPAPALFPANQPFPDLAALRGFYRAQLLEDCVPFWFPRSIDTQHGGFLHCLDRDGSLVDHFDARILNPGHAIEGAWFMMQEGKHRKDSRLVRLGCQMLDWMWKRGWDDEFGGLFYYRDMRGLPVQEYWQDMKFWWPHNEALLAWTLTGDAKYARWHRMVHEWSFARFADPEYGEWYGYLHRDGRISNALKGNLWKSFFHHPRALWFCSQLEG